MNSPTVSKSIFQRVVRANPDWTTAITEGYQVCATQYLDAENNVVASALYQRGAKPEYRLAIPITTDWQGN